MRDIGAYKQHSNITTSISIKGNDESDYLALRRLLKGQRISIGEYLMDAYRELDKDVVDVTRLRTLQMSRWALPLLTNNFRPRLTMQSRRSHMS